MNPLFASPQTVQATHAGGLSELAHVMLALLLVLGVMLVLARIVRRARGTGPHATQLLEVLAQVSLGTKERAVLVRVGSTQVLLGVAPGQVSPLHVLTDAVAPAPAPAASPAFATTFQAMLRRSLGR
jgi:flagellar protein FliO/FliZ